MDHWNIGRTRIPPTKDTSCSDEPGISASPQSGRNC
jgi:hypothetical protein